MQIITTVTDQRQWRKDNLGSVALVPTMGALHDGHLSLIELAGQHADAVAVSIFVNPTQFGPHEDFDRYPRPIADDLARCEAAGVDVVFNPSVDEVYPPDAVPVEVTVPSLASILEGAARPGHYAGVCRVCTKLFNIVRPDVVVFGQKDYQQLKVIEALVADLAMPITVVGGETRRDPDGLALSSRNRYLDPPARERAWGLSKALRQAGRMVDDGETDPAIVEAAMRHTMEAHSVTVDYAVIRHPDKLTELDAIVGPAIALVAGRVDDIHLIDNAVV